jgi:hypothetical protein
VGLSLSAAGKDRHIKMGTGSDGDLYLMFTDERTPMAALRLAEVDRRLFTDLALIDKDEHAGVVVSGGSDPQLRLVDRRQKVRGFFGLGVGGEPRLYVADEESRPIVRQSAFGRMVAERSIPYQALLRRPPLRGRARGRLDRRRGLRFVRVSPRRAHHRCCPRRPRRLAGCNPQRSVIGTGPPRLERHDQDGG